MADRDERHEEGWEQVAGDTSPDSIGAEDQGSDAAEPARGGDAGADEGKTRREPADPRLTEAE